MLKKLINLFKKKTPETQHYLQKEKLKIWHILSGPYSREEVEDPYVPDGLNYMLLCKAEYQGKVFDREFWFESFEEAQVVVNHFKSSIEPMELNI